MYLAELSTTFIVISAILVAIGWRMIKLGQTKRHIQAMVAAALFALTFFILYVSRTVFIGNTAFGGPDDVLLYFRIFLIFHIILATGGAFLGLISLYWGYKKKYERHKKIGPYTAVTWFATAITGVMVYLLLYIIYPPGETTNVFRAIFGW